MSTASHWAQGHPITFAIVLFAASALISLYSQEIKTFLRTWPTTKMRASVLNDARHQLALLNNLHNNTYQLLLWFIWNIVQVVITALLGNILVFFIFLALEYPKFPTAASLGSSFIGIICGQAWRMKLVLRQLYDYDRSVQMLKKKIDDYERPTKGH